MSTHKQQSEVFLLLLYSVEITQYQRRSLKKTVDCYECWLLYAHFHMGLLDNN